MPTMKPTVALKPTVAPTNVPLPSGYGGMASGTASGKTGSNLTPVKMTQPGYGTEVPRLGVGVNCDGIVSIAWGGEVHPSENTVDLSITRDVSKGLFHLRLNEAIVATLIEDTTAEGNVKTKAVVHPQLVAVNDLLDVASNKRQLTVEQVQTMIGCLTNALQYLANDPSISQCRQSFNFPGVGTGSNSVGCIIRRN